LIFTPTPIEGVFVIDVERKEDERGFFARTWCREEFAARGLNPELAQCSISYNRKKGTLRGLHFQREPHAEAKLVRCSRGAIFDVAVDLRPESPSFKSWFAVELSDANYRMLYVPEECAHGFQSLVDEVEVIYQISAVFAPSVSQGLRFDDPGFGIEWPLLISTISERDRSWPLLGGLVE
jgi:dTDP-4-dehydrorhamnose 3,5-epimerase